MIDSIGYAVGIYDAWVILRDMGCPISEYAIRNWCKNGEIKAIQPHGSGTMWLIDRDSIIAKAENVKPVSHSNKHMP